MSGPPAAAIEHQLLVEKPVKHLLPALFVSFMVSGAHAADASCTAQAGEKKLAGAAKSSFMKKCEADAKAACEKAADDKKLAGAARNANLKKCLADAVGP
jgi:hypothetical protein